MANWLEEAERDLRRKSKNTNSERTQIKKDRISENYLHIQEKYHANIETTRSIVERINSLPLEMRESFGLIDFREKDGRLNNHLIVISASQRLKKRKNSFSTLHFKNVRAVYINISKYFDKVDIEIREQFLKRKRLSTRNQEKTDSPDNKKVSFLLTEHIDVLTKDAAMDIVSFVAFKKELEDLPFDLSKAMVKE